MGLGLSICHGIVTAHGGSITVDSAAPAAGPRFRVTLPVASRWPPRPTASAGGRRPPPARPPRRRRVLVVDDEPALGEMIRAHARATTTRSTWWPTPARRSSTCCGRRCAYDLVLCDLMMPDDDRAWISTSEVTRHRPELGQRFVFMTGGAFTDRASEFLARVPNERIDKPFNRAALKALLNPTNA